MSSIAENDLWQLKVYVHHFLVFELGYPFHLNFPPSTMSRWVDVDFLAREWQAWDVIHVGDRAFVAQYVEAIRAEAGL